MKRNRQYYIRRTHRFLGVFLGIQFLLWTLGGLYFSWTDIDKIHGDHFIKEVVKPTFDKSELHLSIADNIEIKSLELKSILGEPYLYVNESQMYHAFTGEIRGEILKEEAIRIARNGLKDELTVERITYLTETGKHHEYRERPLPAWQLDFESPENISVYINAVDGSFQRIRHRQWRWFDFLWMLHTMDYQGRDNMNNLLLRGFSILGLITVMSGFTLFFMTVKRRK